ncbi:FmdB family zinc ribbon protein [Kushneria phosphatilytica]|uniref:Zinc ribbon domain-containing protein n=1 Tax=Kushneria phosphatilytica TaxID=657387 RepID=A0A5C0ZZH0_9GAMM|nr:zinc ribbon domain-containing protein [Kushneria phosphatilytica]QEL11137.1 zinc ribbon domain-containing protein [Kushneria phosphatilytica]
MPIYEYQCQDCGARLEKIQKISASPLTTCPSCHKETLERLISPAGFRLSGQGWYETDFKAGNRRNLAGDSSGSGGSSGSTGKGGAE